MGVRRDVWRLSVEIDSCCSALLCCGCGWGNVAHNRGGAAAVGTRRSGTGVLSDTACLAFRFVSFRPFPFRFVSFFFFFFFPFRLPLRGPAVCSPLISLSLSLSVRGCRSSERRRLSKYVTTYIRSK